jgi:radical SAM protein with 4Fe4S-binding SPASM domain
MTISPESISMVADGVTALHEMGFARVDANVPFENVWGDQVDASLLEFARQLERLVEYYARHEDLEPVRLVNLPIEKALAENGVMFPRWCGSGQPMICYDVDGKPLPCHRFVGISTDKVYSGPLSFPEISMAEATEQTTSPCIACPFVSACPSCLALNWMENSNVDCRTHWHCGFMLLQFKATAKLRILRATRQLSNLHNSDQDSEKAARLRSTLSKAMDVHDALSAQVA